MSTAIPVAERFWDKVDRRGPDECWLWVAFLDTSTGYGRINGRHGKSPLYAHRVAYELLVGPIPEGMDLDHLCRVPACVNPRHLEPVTHAENIRRGNSPAAINARKTHCIHGHAFDEANTRIDRDGGRRCLTCRNKRNRERYRRAA